MENLKLKDLLRWISVFPCAVGASVIGCLILMKLIFIGDFLSGELWLHLQHPEILMTSHFFTSFIIAGLFGCVFVYVGSICAPRYKKAVAFILFGLIAIIFGFLLGLCLFLNDFVDSWRFIANVIICIIASGITAFNANN